MDKIVQRIGSWAFSQYHQSAAETSIQEVEVGYLAQENFCPLLTKTEAELHPPQARVTEVGAAEGIPEVEGEFLTGDIADIQSC